MGSSFFEQVLTIVTTTPGNLVYHILLAFTLIGALQASFSHWRKTGFPQGQRMVIGLVGLLSLQVVQYIVAIFVWRDPAAAHLYLPPLDRAITLSSLVVIVWLWAFPEPTRAGDAATLLLELLVILFFGGSLLMWGQMPQGAYNASILDTIGESIALALLALGFLVLILRRPNGWDSGVGMLTILAAGHLIHWFIPSPSDDYLGGVRLAEMIAFPLLFILPQRFPTPVEALPAATQSEEVKSRPAGIDPEAFNAFLSILKESRPEKLCQAITRAIAEVLVADICLLVTPADESGQIIVSCGYDLIREMKIEGFSLDGRTVPVLSSAFRRAKTLRLPASSTSPDLNTLATALRLERAGHLMAAPVIPPGEPPIMGILLLSPYANRGWTMEDQSNLTQFADSLALFLQRSKQLQKMEVDLARMEANWHTAQEQVGKLNHYNQDLESRLKEIEQQGQPNHLQAESLALLVADHEKNLETIAQLQVELQQAKSAIETKAGQDSDLVQQLDQQLRQSLAENARLQKELAEADRRTLEAARQLPVEGIAPERTQEVMDIVQELRQPMASIIGYTDLLLGESIGILGALQHKFMERVKVSTERMAALVDDMMQIVSMEESDQQLHTEQVDLNLVIDDAVAASMNRLREKNIILRMELPDQLPQLHADHDAIQQILVNLLQNAGEATPPEGEISLHASIEGREDEQGYVLFQITDSGEGIPAEDLPRVFSRLYRTDNSLIRGIGDAGVGLSVVKTLVEAHGGRIWVDTEIGKGSTFSVLLPFNHPGNGFLGE